ncbi:phage tail protein [Pseudomonas sp. Marseille-Q5115]|uniref:phage tail protein n=1 Tax=Pseudomonas sp. Marseille-Q5115 TaxID=2866593 RepID=UPI001CE3DE3A|nr:phage tail protein [Pseudomonas sp. Marseille-Q5115]
MIDSSSQFFAILTNVGAAKQANADALGIAWKITQMGVGDANGTDPIPSATQKTLINEKRRAPLNQLKVDPSNSAIIIAEQIIPAEVGGFWIREIGLYDEAGDLVAVANCAPSFKPLLNQGSGRTQVVRMNLVVSNSANVELKVDGTVVLATRSWVADTIAAELAKLDSKQSVRAATTGPITLSGLQTADDVALVAGDRVLAKDQSNPALNGVWVVASGAWLRATDADNSAEVTPGMLVVVEEGTVNANTIWELVTDGPINLGTTGLVFVADYTAAQLDALLAQKASLDSPVFTNKPTTQLPPQFDNTKRIASTEWVKRQGKQFAGSTSINGAGTVLATSAGTVIPLFGSAAATIALPASSALPIGATLTFSCYNTVASNITANGTDVIYGLAAGQSVSVAVAKMLYGDVLELTLLSNTAGAGAWYVTGGNMTASAVVPRFDVGQRPASTKTLRDRGHEYNAYNGTAASITLTPAHCGGIISMSAAAAATVTLPATAATLEGATITIVNTSPYAAAVVTQGSDVLASQVGAAITVSLAAGDTAEFARVGSDWRLIGGSYSLKYAPEFSFSLTAPYMKSPGGIIIQQVSVAMPSTQGGYTNFAWPIAFPNNFFGCALATNHTASTYGYNTLAVVNRTLSGAQLLNAGLSGTIGSSAPTTILAWGN